MAPYPAYPPVTPIPAPEIRHLSRRDLTPAAVVCARGMRDNPIHIRVFGAAPERRERHLRRFFTTLLPWIHHSGILAGAFLDDTLVGVLGMLPPGRCRPSRPASLRLLPALMTDNSPSALWRVGRWLGTWARRDPRQPHWHLGPLVVDRVYQGQGVGSRLMRYGITHIDARGEAIHLETDRAANVDFYARFGFATTAHLKVLGVPNWLMWRDGRPRETP